MDIEYLRINIEDNSNVPIKLSFPVAYQFLENAFNECKMLGRDRSQRNNALVDCNIISSKEMVKKSRALLNSSALLTPIQADFKNQQSQR